MKINLYILILIFTRISFSQNEIPVQHSPFLRVGTIISLGTHINRIGGFVSLNYTKYNITGNIQLQGYYNYSDLGPKLSSWEAQLRTNINYSFGGKKIYHFIPNFSSTLFTNRKYHIGYGLNFYLNTIKTSQITGSLLGRIENIHLSIENDAFIPFKPTDKYRTGSFKISYLDSTQEISWQTVLWTGQTKCSKRFYVQNDSIYPSRWGYMDYSDCKYANFSNGISSINYNRLLPYYNQIGSIAIGIDSERIRNFWQNKVIHDMPFIPEKWNKAKNLHIPMLDENGDLYLYKDLQKLKKGKPYFHIGTNFTETY